MNYVFRGIITGIYQQSQPKHVSGFGKDAVMEDQLGDWHITINKLLSFNVGPDKPTKEVGQPVEIVLRSPRPEAGVVAMPLPNPSPKAAEELI